MCILIIVEHSLLRYLLSPRQYIAPTLYRDILVLGNNGVFHQYLSCAVTCNNLHSAGKGLNDGAIAVLRAAIRQEVLFHEPAAQSHCLRPYVFGDIAVCYEGQSLPN